MNFNNYLGIYPSNYTAKCAFDNIYRSCSKKIYYNIICDTHLELIFNIKVVTEQLYKSTGETITVSKAVATKAGTYLCPFPWKLNKAGEACWSDLGLDYFMNITNQRQETAKLLLNAFNLFITDGHIFGNTQILACNTQNIISAFIAQNPSFPRNKQVIVRNSAGDAVSVPLDSFPVSARIIIQLFQPSTVGTDPPTDIIDIPPNIVINFASGQIEYIHPINILKSDINPNGSADSLVLWANETVTTLEGYMPFAIKETFGYNTTLMCDDVL